MPTETDESSKLDTLCSLISESNIEVKNMQFNTNSYQQNSFKIGFNAFASDNHNPNALRLKHIKVNGDRKLTNPIPEEGNIASKTNSKINSKTNSRANSKNSSP